MSIDAYPGLAAAQPLDATLSALAALTTTADTAPYFSAVDIAALMTVTPYSRTLFDDPDAASWRTTLGLGTMSQQHADAVAITGGTAAVTALTVNGNATVTGVTNLTGRVYIGGLTPSSYVPMLYVPFDKNAYVGLTIQNIATDTVANPSIAFTNTASAGVGTIVANATSTAYNTTSDARLKHAITALTGAIDVVRALRPVGFRWNADDSQGHGFLAHELQQVIPDAVSGEADAVNEDGSVKPQQVDHSRLVVWLVAAVQELASRVNSLEQQLGI